MATPIRYPNGLSTQAASKPLGSLPFPDPLHSSSTVGKQVFSYYNDFTDVGTTVAYTLTGTPTFALTSGVGGVATLTPSGAAVVGTMARTASAFQFTAGNQFWYVQRFQLSGVGAGVIGKCGLQVGTGANTVAVESLYFTKVTGAAGGVNLVYQPTASGAAVTLATGIVPTTAAATWIDVGFWYDGTDLLVYANDAVVARVTSPVLGTSLPQSTVLLTPFVQVTPVATETLSQDYIFVAQETVR